MLFAILLVSYFRDNNDKLIAVDVMNIRRPTLRTAKLVYETGEAILLCGEGGGGVGLDSFGSG
jgi:hypothetical protein